MEEASEAAPPHQEAAVQVVGWGAVGLVQILVEFATLALSGGASVRALHATFSLLHAILAGGLSAAAVLLWRRFGPAGVRATLGVIAVAGVVVGAVLLRDDAAGIAGTSGVVRAFVGGVVGLSIPAVVLVAGLVARKLPPVPAALGASLALLNNMLLPRGYFGLHLFAMWIAALLVAASAQRMIAAKVTRAIAGKGVAAAGAVGALAAVAVVWSPSSAVKVDMMRTPGDAIAPWLGRLSTGRSSVAARDLGPWYADRAGLPDVPPTGPAITTGAPIVVLLTVDAFRWDLVDTDEHLVDLPVLHRLRDEGAYFREARSPSPSTVTSISTIFTGKFYSQLYWTEQTGAGHQKLFPHKDPTPRVSALLGKQGVATTLVLSGTGFADKFGLTDGFQEKIGKGLPTGIPAVQITDAVMKRMEKQGPGPLFIYSHYFEPHAPYDRGGKEGTPFERYVREVAIVDKELGKLFAAVERLGLKDRFILILTADHGEAFGEHGTKEHGVSLYDELEHVPLIIAGAGVKRGRIDALVSLTDLGPTIFDLFGKKAPAIFLGQSLVPFLRGERPKLERPVVAESGRLVRAMFFDDGTKVIEDRRLGTIELFDLKKDPKELTSIYDAGDATSKAKLGRMRAYFEAHELHRDGYELPYRP